MINHRKILSLANGFNVLLTIISPRGNCISNYLGALLPIFCTQDSRHQCCKSCSCGKGLKAWLWVRKEGEMLTAWPRKAESIHSIYTSETHNMEEKISHYFLFFFSRPHFSAQPSIPLLLNFGLGRVFDQCAGSGRLTVLGKSFGRRTRK